jgi:hypothetical protein
MKSGYCGGHDNTRGFRTHFARYGADFVTFLLHHGGFAHNHWANALRCASIDLRAQQSNPDVRHW